MSELLWYAIQTYSGHENKVQKLIQRLIEDEPGDPENRELRDVIVPTQEVLEMIQTYKGLMYIAVMSLLVCIAVKYSFSREQRIRATLRVSEERYRNFVATSASTHIIDISDLNYLLGHVAGSWEGVPSDYRIDMDRNGIF